MMGAIFTLLTLIILLALGGKYRAAITLFCLNLVLSALLFWHHVTTHIPVNF